MTEQTVGFCVFHFMHTSLISCFTTCVNLTLLVAKDCVLEVEAVGPVDSFSDWATGLQNVGFLFPFLLIYIYMWSARVYICGVPDLACDVHNLYVHVHF